MEPALLQAIAKLGDPTFVAGELRPDFVETTTKPLQQRPHIRSRRGRPR